MVREREDGENESGISEDTLEKLAATVSKDSDIWQILIEMKASSRDRQLTAVRTAIANFMRSSLTYECAVSLTYMSVKIRMAKR